jgi:hypothetical protein
MPGGESMLVPIVCSIVCARQTQWYPAKMVNASELPSKDSQKYYRGRREL